MLDVSSPIGPAATLVAEAGLVAAAAVFRVLQPRISPRYAAAVNVGGALACVAVAHRLGATNDDLGVHPRRVVRGVLTGAAAATLIGATVAGAYALPATRAHFDGHVDDPSLRATLREVLVSIPFGTALSEELIFRGAIHGLSARRFGPIGALATDVVLFGLWHLGDHGAARNALPEERHPALAAVGTVVATGLAGAGFSGLRMWSGSVLAPILAHDALNVSGYLAARQRTIRNHDS